MASPEADRAAAPLLPGSLSAAPRRVAARVATSTQGAAHSAARHGRLFTLDSDGATSEVYLGIGATLLGTLAIWMVCMPVFDIGGTALIRRFEGNSSAGHREPVRLGDFEQRVLTQYDTPEAAFTAMDDSSAGVVDLAEFIRAAKKYDPPLSDGQAEMLFKGLDVDGDELLSPLEFAGGLGKSRGAAIAASAADPPPQPHAAAPLGHHGKRPAPAPEEATAAPAPAEKPKPGAPAAQKPAAPADSSLPVPQYAAGSSFVAAPAERGATRVSVADEGLFHVGDLVRLVGSSGRADAVRVTSLGPPLAFEPPLMHGYAKGCEVRLEQKANASGARPSSVAHDAPQHSHRKGPAPNASAPNASAPSAKGPAPAHPAPNASAPNASAPSAKGPAPAQPAPNATREEAGEHASAGNRSENVNASAGSPSAERALTDANASAVAAAAPARRATAPAMDALARAGAPTGAGAGGPANASRPSTTGAPHEAPNASRASTTVASHEAPNASRAGTSVAPHEAPNASRASTTVASHEAPNASRAGTSVAPHEAPNASRAGTTVAPHEAPNASRAGTTDAPHETPARATSSTTAPQQVVAYRPGRGAEGSGAPAQSETTVAPGHRWAALTSELTVEQLQRSMGPFAPDRAFDVLDVDLDGKTSLDDWLRGGKAFEPPLVGRRAEAAFRALDADGDGAVSKEEFLNTLKAGAFFPQRDAKLRRTQQSSGHRLDVAELLDRVAYGRGAAAAAAGAPTSSDVPARSLDSRGLRDSFALLDKDHDGVLLLDNLASNEEDISPPLTLMEAECTFLDMDIDRDGKVSLAEFLFASQEDRRHFYGACGGQPHPGVDSVDQAIDTATQAAPSVAQVVDTAAQSAYSDGRFLANGAASTTPPAPAAPPASPTQPAGPQFTLATFEERMRGTYSSADAAFTELDSNGDGVCDFEEFVVGVLGFRPPLTGPQAAYSFKGLDADQDGVVAREEFLRAAGAAPAAGGGAAPGLAEEDLGPAAAAAVVPGGPPARATGDLNLRDRVGDATPDLIFETMDANGDGAATLDEFLAARTAFTPSLSKQEAESVFAGMDRDADSEVDAGELAKALQEAGAGGKAAHGAGQSAGAEGAGAEGAGAGGAITAKEFRSRMPSTSLEDAFEALDGNDDGFIDANEIAMSTKAFVPPLNAAEAVIAFGGLDADHDGKLAQAEFVEVLKSGKFVGSSKAEAAPSAPPKGRGAAREGEEEGAAAASDASPQGHGADGPEYLAGLDLRQRMGAISLQDAMAMLDGDQAGSLSSEEWVDGRKAFVPALTTDEAKASFAAMDSDGDGEVSYDELSAAIPAQDDVPVELAPSVAKDLATVADDVVQRDATSTATSTAAPTTKKTTKKTTKQTTTTTATETTTTITETETRERTTTYTFPFPSTLTETATASESSASTTAAPTTAAPTAAASAGTAARSHGKSLRGSANSKVRHEAAATTTSLPYDCAAGFNNWKAGWSDGKKRWCCDHEQAGCDGGTISIDQLMERMRSSIGSPPEAMRLLDEDGGGDISLEEFVGATAALKKSLNKKEAEFAFQGLDADGDYKVTSSEFFGALKAGQYFHEGLEKSATWTTSTTSTAPPLSFADFQSRLAGFGSPKNAFFEMDDDDDGSLSKQELLAHAGSFGPPLSEQQALDALAGLDDDGDGGVSSDELFGALEAGKFSKGSKPASKPRPKQEKDKTMKTAEDRKKKATATSTTSTTAGVTTGPAAASGVAVSTGRWFRVQLEQWAGSLQAACDDMDLEEDGMISPDEFSEGMSSLKPPVSARDAGAVFSRLDLDGDGRLAPEECNPGGANFEAALAPIGDVQNVYKSMDADSDGKLSKEEFVALGPLLDPPMSQGSMLPLFSEADADGDGFVSPEELPGPAAAGAEGDEADEASDDGPRLADRELAAYRRVPAIASGTAELVLTLRPDVKVPRPSELSKDVGEAFQAELGKQLGLDVNLASAESVGDGGTVRSVLLMWTADAEDGGAVQATLQSRATAIEKAVEERVTGLGAPWMRGGTAELWLGCSLDFYGPGAASLPRGSKLVRKLGVQKDRQAAHSLDSHAGGGAEARP